MKTGNIIRTAPCCVVYNSCAQRYAHKYEQFLYLCLVSVRLGIVELCAKILQIMRNDFKDYARTFCQLCAPIFGFVLHIA